MSQLEFMKTCKNSKFKDLCTWHILRAYPSRATAGAVDFLLEGKVHFQLYFTSQSRHCERQKRN